MGSSRAVLTVFFGLWLSHQEARQLSDVTRYTSSLIHGEHFSRVGVSSGLAAVNVSEGLPVGVQHFIATGICSTDQGGGKRRSGEMASASR